MLGSVYLWQPQDLLEVADTKGLLKEKIQDLLTEPGSHFELFAIWKKQSRMGPTISKFIDVLVAELKSLCTGHCVP
jgi:DNA-binding transcriptional LysR family regulator